MSPDHAPLVTIRDLSVEYRVPRGEVAALAEVSLHVGSGERVAVIGESGSGKSTLTRALLGVLPENAHLRADAFDLEGTDLLGGLDEKAWDTVRRGRIGFVPQDPNIALDPVLRIGRQLSEAIRLGEPHVERADERARALALLTSVGIEDAERVHGAYPHQLSGGQRQRVLLAIALIGSPRLIVADEPTSGLDVAVQKIVLDLLDTFVAERGVSVLLVTHDLAVAAERSDRTVVLSRGRVVEDRPTAQLVIAPRAEYTRRLLDAVPRTDAGRLPVSPGLSAFVDSSPSGGAGGNLGQSPVVPAHVELVGLEKSYRSKGGARGRGAVHAVRGVDLRIGRSRTYGLVGQSGSGKSTLARLVAGIDAPDDGDVLLDGRSLVRGKRSERRSLRRRVQFVFQNPYGSLDPRQSVERILAEPLEGAREEHRGASAQRRIAETLDAVGLPASAARRRPTELSGGQRQRVAIARGIIVRPELLVLDEPVSALDVSVQAQVLQLLVDLQHEYGTTYLFITHDLAVVSQIAHVVGVLREGEVIEEGEPSSLLAAPGHDYTRRLVEAIPSLVPAA